MLKNAAREFGDLEEYQVETLGLALETRLAIMFPYAVNIASKETFCFRKLSSKVQYVTLFSRDYNWVSYLLL